MNLLCNSKVLFVFNFVTLILCITLVLKLNNEVALLQNRLLLQESDFKKQCEAFYGIPLTPPTFEIEEAVKRRKKSSVKNEQVFVMSSTSISSAASTRIDPTLQPSVGTPDPSIFNSQSTAKAIPTTTSAVTQPQHLRSENVDDLTLPRDNGKYSYVINKDWSFGTASKYQNVEVVHAPTFNLHWEGGDMFYNLNLFCINPRYCKTKLSEENSLRKYAESESNIWGIFAARRGDNACPGAKNTEDDYAIGFGFLTTSWKVRGFVRIPVVHWHGGDKFLFDCRFFALTPSQAATMCGTLGGPVALSIDVENGEIKHEIFLRLTRDFRQRNIVPIEGSIAHWRIYPHQIAEWGKHVTPMEGYKSTDYYSFVVDESEDDGKETVQIQNSAGFLKIPFLEGQLLGVGHKHYEEKGVMRWGHHYVHSFFTIDEAEPWKIRHIGREFCIFSEQIKDAHRIDDCEIIQFIMSLTETVDGKILIGYGVSDCHSRVMEMKWDEIRNLLNM